MLANKPLAKYDQGTVEKMNNVLKCEMYDVLVMKMTKQKSTEKHSGGTKSTKELEAVADWGSGKDWEVLQELQELGSATRAPHSHLLSLLGQSFNTHQDYQQPINAWQYRYKS